MLDPLDGAGRVVTVDAWHAQTKTARDLLGDQPAHDVMTVKGTPPSIHDARAALEAADFSPAGPHGGPETRVVRTSTALTTYLDRPLLGQAFRVDRHPGGRRHRGARGNRLRLDRSDRRRCRDAGRLRPPTRLHDIRAMTYDEGRSPVRAHSGPRVMAALRNTAIDLLRTCGVTNIQRAVTHWERHPDPVSHFLLG